MTINWQVYIILCSDNSFYTGITMDIDRRFLQHKEGRWAKFFRGRQPLRVVYLENGHCRSSASRREVRIKTMNKMDKVLLVSKQSTNLEKALIGSSKRDDNEKMSLLR